MKMQIRLLFLIYIVICLSSAKAQTVIISSPSAPCAGASGTVQLGLNLPVPLANTYSWSISPSATITPIAPNGSVIIGSFTPGTYTVTIYPFAIVPGNIILIPAGVTSTVINVAPGPTINLSLSTSTNLCIGNTTTITASGASTYTWTNGSAANTLAIAPAQSTVLTVYGQGTGTCVSYANVTLNVASAAPVLTLSQPSSFSLCNNLAVLQASGAANYSWSTGANNTAQISINSLGCYSVIGTNGCGSSTTSACAIASSTPGALSVSYPMLACTQGPITLSVSNSGNFSQITWSDSTNTTFAGALYSPTIISSSCYTVNATLGNCTTSSIICVPLSTFSLSTNPSGSFSLCSLNPNISAFGANTYTWIGASGSSTNAVLSPTAIGCYTLVASGNTACPTSSTTVCVSAFVPPPNPSIIASDSIGCVGSTFTLSASGNTGNFSWQGTVNNQPVTVAGVQTVFSPTVFSVGCFTLTETVPGCTASAVQCHSVFPNSPPQIYGLDTLCNGDTTTLYCFDAINYNWSTGSTINSAFISPTVSTCYTVIGSYGACTLQPSTFCVFVKPTPSVSIVASNTSICNGSSVTYSAFGAPNYIWQGSAPGATYNTVPGILVTVEGIGSNGCIGLASDSVAIDTTCSDVWPGDVDSDGFVTSFDVLELGLHANFTGPQRSVTGNSFTPYFANNWLGTISNGKNICHADCNGDGIVNNNDTVAIFNNFNLSHYFRPHPISSTEQLQLVPSANGIEIGRWNELDIVLGTGSNSVQSYGLCFEVNFDANMFETDSIWIDFANSSFLQNNQAIYFRKVNFAAGKLYVALTRADQVDIYQAGKVATLHTKTKNNLIAGTPISFEITNVAKSLSSGEIQPVNGDLQNTTATDNLTGISTLNAAIGVNVFPKPTTNIVSLKGKEATLYTVKIFDIIGRKVEQKTFITETTISVANYDIGTYQFEISGNNGSKVERVTVVH